jgi:defect-in-organelle-trafficking protein DotD
MASPTYFSFSMRHSRRCSLAFWSLRGARTMADRIGRVKLSAIANVLGLTFLAGCASPYDVPTTVATSGMANPELALQVSMREVDSELGRIGKLRPKPVSDEDGVVVPGELNKVLSFSWSGSLDEGVEKLAHSIGYTVSISAPPNPQSLTLGLSTGPLRAYDIFRQIGDQAGDRATVTVDPQQHLVEVIHHV